MLRWRLTCGVSMPHVRRRALRRRVIRVGPKRLPRRSVHGVRRCRFGLRVMWWWRG